MQLRFAAFILVLALAACSGASIKARMDKASEYEAAGKLDAAVIELRNVLQIDERHAAARHQLGRVLHKSGDVLGAIDQFERALAQERNDERRAEYALDLGRSLIAAGQPNRLLLALSGISEGTPLQIAELNTLRAVAHGQMQQTELAEKMLGEALQALPGHLPALMLRARTSAAQGRAAEALANVRELTSRHPGDADLQALLGDLELVQGNARAAGAAWDAALAVQPTHLGALAARVRTALADGDTAAMNKALAALRKSHPRHPQTVELLVRAALQGGRPDEARDYLAPLLKAAPNHLRVLMLAGEVEWAASSRITALAHLQKAVAQAPDVAPARELMAQMHLRAGEAEVALQVLDRLLKSDAPGAETLGLAGHARLMLGDFAAAEKLYQRAAAANPRDKRWPAAQAAAATVRGDAARGLARLQQLAAQDPTGPAGMALVQTLRRRGDDAGALRQLQALEAGLPRPDPALVAMRAQMQQSRGDDGAALDSYRQLLALDPANLVALEAITARDLKQSESAAALARLRAVLKSRPSHGGVALLLARTLQAAGAPAGEVQAALEAAARIASEPRPALLLVAHHLQRGSAEKALAVARDALARFPQDIPVQEALAQAQMEVGDYQQAILAYRRLARARPQDPVPLVALAQAHARAGEAERAAQALREAADKAPRHEAVITAQFEWALAERRWPDALAVARSQQRIPAQARVGWRREARVWTAQGRWSDAAAAWAKVSELGGGGYERAYWAVALKRAGREREADDQVRQWLAKRPGDVELHLGLADQALAARELGPAEAHLRAVLQAQPENIAALGNLAYVLSVQGRKGGLEWADRALRLDPDQASLVDTRSLALAAEGRADEAVKQQKALVDRHPRSARYRLTLARVALKKGDRDLAKAQLDAIRNLTPSPQTVADARELLARLQR